MKRLYFDIDKENNKVILDRKDFDYLMSIGHCNDNAIEYIENEIPYLLEIETEDEDINGNYVYTYKEYTGIDELLDILKGSDKE